MGLVYEAKRGCKRVRFLNGRPEFHHITCWGSDGHGRYNSTDEALVQIAGLATCLQQLRDRPNRRWARQELTDHHTFEFVAVADSISVTIDSRTVQRDFVKLEPWEAKEWIKGFCLCIEDGPFEGCSPTFIFRAGQVFEEIERYTDRVPEFIAAFQRWVRNRFDEQQAAKAAAVTGRTWVQQFFGL